ncbi:beta family protein [Parablastomonas sp. CN1-191]|uniref:beta family protein n=1 Tax=Parablastomonas sp. CN1-191 TaxID=3400908 RepID=UPI003BF9197F
MPHRYIPMMKTKAGEIDALANLSPQARSRMLPLFHVCETVSPRFAGQLALAIGGQVIGLDGSFNFQHTGTGTTFSTLLAALRGASVPTMPSIGLNDPQAYQQLGRSLVDQNGLIIKVSVANLSMLASFVAASGIAPVHVDVVLDVRHVASIDVPSYSGYLISVLSQHASVLSAYRSVTLAAAAAPKDHTSLSYGANNIPRTDWLLWSAVRTQVPFSLDYGDYLTGHPDLNEPPGVAMANATVSARYTLDNSWLIIKGRSTGGPYGQPMQVQYQSHAGAIAGNAGFGGVNAWADGQITQAAAGAPKMASRQKWASFAANRHLSLVAARLP